jgi:hypothetical protein
MPVFFGKIRYDKGMYLFTDPVLGICSNFPKLNNFEEHKNYIFVFSNNYFPEADHVLKNSETGFVLDEHEECYSIDFLNKYFSEKIDCVHFFLEPIKEDKNA